MRELRSDMRLLRAELAEMRLELVAVIGRLDAKLARLDGRILNLPSTWAMPVAIIGGEVALAGLIIASLRLAGLHY